MSPEYPVSNIVDVFHRAEAPAMRRKTFLSTEREISFGEVADRTRRLTRFYHDLGLRPGDRVAIASHDDLEVSVLFLSLLRNGIAAVPIDPDTKALRFEHILRTAKPRAVILDTALREAWKPSGIERVIEIADARPGKGALFNRLMGWQKTAEAPAQTYPAILRDLPGMEGPAVIDQASDAYILFTSGTTSEPKGVRISHKNLFSHVRTLSRQFGYGPDCRLLNILSLAHVDGIVQGPVVAFANGASLYRPLRFEVQRLGRLLDAVYTHRITHFITVPTVLSLIERLCADQADAFLQRDFRFIISTGAYLDARLWRSFEERFQVRIANVYGLTESVTGGLFSGPTDADHVIGTVGKPADCEVRLVDDRGRQVAGGAPGELLMKGDHIMQGYVNAPAATAAVLRDGWLLTGDMATKDEQGVYRIVGRKKNIIITGGINVQPEEITEVLKLSPAVVDAVTFGVPDDTWGERIVAAVVLDPPGATTEQELAAFCRSHIEQTKVPHRIHVMPSLPKGAVGKVVIEEVKELIRQREASGTGEGREDVESEVIAVAAACFNVSRDELTLATGPEDTTGWDSLAHLELVSRLEERFKIAFSPAEIMQIERLNDAWKIVREKLS